MDSSSVDWSWPVLGSEWVFPSSVPQALHLSQSCSVSREGVAEVYDNTH